MPPIQTAILGYGRSGSAMHAGAIAANPPFKMAAVCDIDPARRDQARERFGCPVYGDYHEMLRKEALDLVCVITRSDQHCQMTCDCLAAGVNVLVTKPWALDEREARRMIAAAESSGRLLLPWLPARWGTDLTRLQALIAERAIGDVFLVRRAVSTFATRCDWQTERRYGGGYLLNWGPHIIDPPVLLMRSPVRSVYARMRQTINPGDTEDLFLAILTLENGVVVQAEHTVSVDPLPNWFIQGTAGSIVMHGRDLAVHRSIPAQPGDPTQYATMKAETEQAARETVGEAVYGDEKTIYAELAQAIRGEKPPAVTPADALRLTRVLDAIRLSDAQNRVVEIDRP